MKNTLSQRIVLSATIGLGCFLFGSSSDCVLSQERNRPATAEVTSPKAIQSEFETSIRPLLKKYCQRCHDANEMMSGIRVDTLDGSVADDQIRLWQNISAQVAKRSMPPEDEVQPTAEQQTQLVEWIEAATVAARSRVRPKNGSIRRLTVAQYGNSLRDLLGIDDHLIDVLPADAVSKDGFLNNEATMQLSPLLLEAYFLIAERALDRAIVDESQRPAIQSFRMELGARVNQTPCPDNLILGANSLLLDNADFVVTEPLPQKEFPFEHAKMRTHYRFIEGYQGNATVRGWREYDSIYHSVFACMRGTPGYPRGRAYESITEGLLLRPAIPSAELFQVESTYGPKANFKISLRQLPDVGRFRVTVTAAKYDDALLLDQRDQPQVSVPQNSVVIENPKPTTKIELSRDGIYQLDVHLQKATTDSVTPDATRLAAGRVGQWSFEPSEQPQQHLRGQASLKPSPFGQALNLPRDDAADGSFVVDRTESMNVAEGEFTVAAWIRPERLQQGGIVCLGGYGYTHGWLFDLPNNRGEIRIETANARGEPNGTVTSRANVIRAKQWQHVAVVVRRGQNATKLFVNGFEVGRGTIHAADLDNPQTQLHIGRIPRANVFAGAIDEVSFHRRALSLAELQALIEPGREFAKTPPPEKPRELDLTLGNRKFRSQLTQPAFLVARLASGPLELSADYAGRTPIEQIVLTRLEDSSDLARRFQKFEQRVPRLGVHVGLRRDCGSTLTQVGSPRPVESTDFAKFVFEDEISNYPSPDVEKDNVNYLAGIREIGVRSEFTDGRAMPRLLIRTVQFEGPYYESWPPRTHRNIFIESDQSEPDQSDRPGAYAREIIKSFATRAYRRPLADHELQSLFRVWNRSYEESGDFVQSVRDALLVVLTSPQFLFLIESSASPQPEPIDDWELASKLSYFLWNTSPDQRLLDLASRGELRGALDEEVDRLVADPRFDQFAVQFASQWLSLEKLDVLEIDRKRYPHLTRDTRVHLRREPVEFLKYLLRENLPLSQLIDADFLVANEVVASYYGLGDRLESGFDFRPIPIDRPELGGLLTQAGLLAGLSDGREANPVKRGAWFARKIIAEPPADPPPNVPALPEDDNSSLTLREKLEQHRNQKGCAQCHAGIDPWGLPFQEFDASGIYQRTAASTARSTLPDRTNVRGVSGLKAYLIRDRLDQVAFSLLKHFAIYGTGRELSYNEIEFLRAATVESKDSDFRVRDLLKFVITSRLFLEK